jgi:hypothetical protein
LSFARIFDLEVQRALLFWWHLTSDHCGGDHGFHVTSSKLHDVTAVRVASQKSEFQNNAVNELIVKRVLGEMK